MMYGVTSLLDEKHDAAVRALWDEMAQKLGIRSEHDKPVPHFSYHVASGYNMDHLKETLAAFARRMKPFTVRTNGLGVFTGESPTLFIPVIIDPGLLALHERLWEPITATAYESSDHYHPNNWLPHITLAGHTTTDHETLRDAIYLLSARDFNWEITIDNLTVIGSNSVVADNQEGVLAEFDLTNQ